jgi:hypothetical protein
LEYFKKDYKKCRMLLWELGGPAAINDPDLLHVYIATLVRLQVGTDSEAGDVALDDAAAGETTPTKMGEGGPTLKDKALMVCYRALFRLSSDGLLHEAIGFRIALAHYTLSINGRVNAAEAILNQVHLDTLEHGCSERTFLAFMLQAGLLLKRDKRELRAYASYLRPCLERSIARGYVREASRAAEVALLVLNQIKDRRIAASLS